MSDQESEFESFWSHYPRKEGKEAARKAWMKLKPSPSLQTEIGISLANQITNNWRDRSKQYIPHASTWLNNSRWEDEITAPTPRNGGGKPAYRDKHGNYTEAGLEAKARGEI